MDDSLYDEFGNYLGPDLEEEEDEDVELEQAVEEEEEQPQQDAFEQDHVEESALMQIDGDFDYFLQKNCIIYTFSCRHSS
ncbi:hypothetical protein RMCBS344292_16596 [Rhizopus microsporus]|nr:hypothetical protein RMCBS344292_16596 [Rhizopus microsporus]